MKFVSLQLNSFYNKINFQVVCFSDFVRKLAEPAVLPVFFIISI